MPRPAPPLARAVAALAAPAALAACAPSAARSRAPESDVVIANARVVDGTGNPWFWGDVALRGGRVARVAPRGLLAGARARERVDAGGQVVAPGFIDIQSHSWDALLWGDGRVVGKVAQGVTTEILGEATTPAPVNDAVLALIETDRTDSTERALNRGFRGRRGFGAWLDAMARHPKSVNVGSYLGATTVRAYAMGRRAGAPGPAELDTMRRVVDDAMRDGAVGLATALIYPPGSYATTAELTAMTGAMRGRGAYITHLRSEGGRLLEAADEAIAIARGGGAPLVIYHLKATGRCNWPKARAVVAKIDSARAAGMDVTATMYPYAASGNNLAGGIVPGWAEEDGRLLDNLRDTTARRRMLDEMTGRAASASEDADGVTDPACLTDPAAIMVLGFRDSTLARYNGWRLDAIARDRGRPWAEAMLDLLLAERGALSKLTFGMHEENIAMQLRRPWVVIGSDAGGQDPARARGLTHPRAYGTFARVLGKYVRQDTVLALEDAVRRMTGATAQSLGLRDRGLLREGMRADVVLFDPAAVADLATYERPHQLARGVSRVWVNGVAVWRDGSHTGATPGEVVRGAGYEPGAR
jgi:dihydroorotase/N-acyl-D-amino-acid deacylase